MKPRAEMALLVAKMKNYIIMIIEKI